MAVHSRFRPLAPTLVEVPAGTFLLGAHAAQPDAPTAWFRDEMPQHPVILEGFQISRGPITCAEYAAFVIATDYRTPPYWGGDDPPAALADHPVVDVTYNDARWYCRWLSTATGRSFRLPSEAEWERAARGDDQRMFPWGDQYTPGACNSAEAGRGGTSPVGSYPRDTSPYGCVDMAGNVEEWTSSPYAPYPGSQLAPPAQQQLVARGGSWELESGQARCTRRHARAATLAGLSRGFRVVCTEE